MYILAKCELNEKGAKILSESIKKSPNLKALVLIDNPIKAEGVNYILESILKCSHLETLSLCIYFNI